MKICIFWVFQLYNDYVNNLVDMFYLLLNYNYDWGLCYLSEWDGVIVLMLL